MVSSRTRTVRGIVRAALLVPSMALLTFAAHSASLSVSENGSTLILPLFKAWVSAYANVDPDLHMTLGGNGSEAGIHQAIANQVQIGTSDAYKSDTQAMAHPNILNEESAPSYVHRRFSNAFKRKLSAVLDSDDLSRTPVRRDIS